MIINERPVFGREGSVKLFSTRRVAFADYLIEKYNLQPKSAFEIVDNSTGVLRDLMEYNNIDIRYLCLAKKCDGYDHCNE